jgi:transposase
MVFVNGELQARFMTRIRGLDPQRCLAVPVDVGKAVAVALVADHYGEMIVAPIEFALTEDGFAVLLAAVIRAQNEREAVVVRVGVEAAGHYHRTLVARLQAAGLEVVELNPRAVKDARGQQLLRTLKNDARDCGAMAELLIRGSGRPPQCRDEALAAQAAWVAHRRRKVAAQIVLSNQIHGQLDLIFPGLTGCFSHGLEAASLRVLIRDMPDPDRVRRLGVDGVLRFVRRRGVQMTHPKAEQVVRAAHVALRLPSIERPAPLVVLAADWALFEALDQQIREATAELAELLPKTPAGVLLGIPGVGVVAASTYGAAIGDPTRYRDAAAAYRASGLVPIRYESAGRARPRTGISREGSVELRRAIVDLGRGIGLHHPDFISYRRQLIARGKPPLVAMIAVAHRAHRLAFAMLRSQRPFDADRWARAVAGHRHRTDEQARHGNTPAVGGPPERRDLPAQHTLTHAEASSN